MDQHFNKLRQRYPVFIFENYSIQNNDATLELEFHFHVEGLASFAPKWVFPKSLQSNLDAPDAVLRKLVFSMGMVELISYWKATCSPRVVVKAGFLNAEEIQWWKKLYYYGLGEFFYTNNISTTMDGFMEIETDHQQQPCNPVSNLPGLTGSLIPVGGGKDSAVSLDLLKASRGDDACFVINPRGASLQCAQVAGFTASNSVFVSRSLDPNLLLLNKAGFLNGHTPFSAIVAFSSVLAAHLHSKAQVVLSNESSANESTVKGTLVNHQYSKSFEFENDFREYDRSFIGSGIDYFSLLRPFSELQISKYFSKLRPYHTIFKSCNVGSKQDIWCCNCSKCLFVYLILSPYLEQDYLESIFGENLLYKAALIPIFEQLIGVQDRKPFECVGTIDELNTAISLAIKKIEQAGSPLPRLLTYYKTLPLYEQYRSRPNMFDDGYDAYHFVPARLFDMIKDKFLHS